LLKEKRTQCKASSMAEFDPELTSACQASLG